MNERQTQIIESARSLIGTPFHHQGRVPHVGIDCIGLLVSVANSLGLPVVDWPHYKRFPKHSVLSSHIAKSGCTPVKREDMAPGHILTFWFLREGIENHTGILASVPEEGRLTLIHAYHGAGGVVEHNFGPEWQKKIMNVWALPSGDNE